MELRRSILDRFGASESDWKDYRWHLEHIFRDVDEIGSLVKLEQDEILGLQEAGRAGIPVQITPYYLSIFSARGRTSHDRAARAQVIPSVKKPYERRRQRFHGGEGDQPG